MWRRSRRSRKPSCGHGESSGECNCNCNLASKAPERLSDRTNCTVTIPRTVGAAAPPLPILPPLPPLPPLSRRQRRECTVSMRGYRTGRCEDGNNLGNKRAVGGRVLVAQCMSMCTPLICCTPSPLLVLEMCTSGADWSVQHGGGGRSGTGRPWCRRRLPEDLRRLGRVVARDRCMIVMCQGCCRLLAQRCTSRQIGGRDFLRLL